MSSEHTDTLDFANMFVAQPLQNWLLKEVKQKLPCIQQGKAIRYYLRTDSLNKQEKFKVEVFQNEFYELYQGYVKLCYNFIE